MIEIVPATAEMLAQLSDEPLPRTVRALAVVDGDQVLGAGGYYPDNAALMVFSAISKEARAEIGKHKRTLVTCARRVLTMARDQGLPVYAICNREFSGAEAMLRHFGFVPYRREVFQWRG